MRVEMFTYESGAAVAFDKVLEVDSTGKVQALIAIGMTFSGDIAVLHGPSMFPAPGNQADEPLICVVKAITKRRPLEHGNGNRCKEVLFDLPNVDLENNDPGAQNAILVGRFEIEVDTYGRILFTRASPSFRVIFVNFSVTGAGSIHDAYRRSGEKGSIWESWLNPNKNRKQWQPKS